MVGIHSFTKPNEVYRVLSLHKMYYKILIFDDTIHSTGHIETDFSIRMENQV